MRHLVAASLVIVGLIHLLPITGVFGADRLAALYGIAVDDLNLAILMRHRAVLFGLLGAFLLLAAFKPALQFIAFVAGFVSVISFLWLVLAAGDYNAQIARVFVVDLVALASLVVGAGAYAWMRRRA
jgi:hypothetical protein